MKHKVIKKNDAYVCTECGEAHGDGDGFIGKECRPTKVIAIGKKKGSKYIFCEKTEYGNMYRVSTAKAWPNTWLIDEDGVYLLPDDSSPTR